MSNALAKNLRRFIMTTPTASLSSLLHSAIRFPNCNPVTSPWECDIVFNDSEAIAGYVIATGYHDREKMDAYVVVMWHNGDGLSFATTPETGHVKHIEVSDFVKYEELPEEVRDFVASSRKLCRKSILGKDYRKILPRQVITVINPATMVEFGVVVDEVHHQIDRYDDCHETLIIGRECDLDEPVAVAVNYELSPEQLVYFERHHVSVYECEPHHIS